MDKKAIDVTKSVTILCPREVAYAFWRDFENLPTFMHHLERVESRGDGRSHWCAKKPGGGTVEWEAALTQDLPNEAIAWRSVGEDDDVENAGIVRFLDAPGNRGTEVHVILTYDPPGGKVGKAVAKLLGEEPNQQLSDDLKRFKQFLEIGEVTRSAGSPEGVGQGIKEQRPSQPHVEDAVHQGGSL